MPLSYDQVKQVHDIARTSDPERFGNMSLQDFSHLANQASNSREFDIGTSGPVMGSLLDLGSLKNKLIDYTGLPQQVGEAGGTVGSALDALTGHTNDFYKQHLESIGHGLPSAGADIAMMAFGGPAGFAAGVGSGALNAYSETGDPRDAIKSAVLQSILPGTSALGKRVLTTALARGSSRLAPALSDAIYAGGRTTDVVNKIGGFAGMYGGQMAGDILTNKVLGRPAFGEEGMTGGEYALTQLAGAAPFGIMEAKPMDKATMFTPKRPGKGVAPANYARQLQDEADARFQASRKAAELARQQA